MKPWLKHAIIVICMLLLTIPGLAQDEDEDELPVIPYVTASGVVENFNIPVPEGWENTGTSSLPQMTHPDVDGGIYVVAVGADDMDAGRLAAIQQILPDFDAEPRSVGELNMDGNIWTQATYDAGDGQALSAFSLLREGVVYTLFYLDSNPDDDLYMIATRPNPTSVETGIEEAVTILFEGINTDANNTEQVELSNGMWTRSNYDEVDDEPVQAMGQLRGNTAFTIVQRGDGDGIDTVNKAFFTVLFGFFVTPQTASYLYLGLAVIAFAIAALIMSMVVRRRNLIKDAAVIAELSQESA